LSDGSEIVVNLQQDSKSTGGEVFVLLNGLVYELNRWDQVANQLVSQGHTVIRYSYSAQPANLRRLAKGQEPKFFSTGLDPAAMSNELLSVLQALKVNQKVHVVGLSYGASVAAAFSERHPELVEDVIFVSPLVVPTDNYDGRSVGLRAWLDGVRFWENAPCSFYGAMNPWLCSSQDRWYDTFYKSLYQTYLLGNVKNVAVGVEPEIYKKSLFHLIRAARDFDLRSSIRNLKNVSMFVASDDDKLLRADQELAWKAVPDAERRSYVLFEGAHHALPDEAPERLVALLTAVALKDADHIGGSRTKVKADR
ncbi:MAG: alpha/beta hydrolase, partial [Proteobacteria bacterium]